MLRTQDGTDVSLSCRFVGSVPLELDLTFLTLSVFILKMGIITIVSIFQGLREY